MANETDKKLLSTIRHYIENKDGSFVSQRLQSLPAGKMPKWKVELVGYIQIWNNTHKNDVIKIDIDNIDDKKLLNQITVLQEKFGK